MGPEMPERGTKTSTETVFSAIFGIISTPSNWFHVKHDWWPWTIPGYITMSRRKSNNKRSCGTAAQLVPKISECQKPLENFSSRFLGIKTTSLSLIIFQSAKILTRSIILLCWCNWGAFWRKNPAGSLTGFPISWSPTLFYGFDPVGQPPVPWIEIQLKSHNFSFDAKVNAAAENCLEEQTSDFFLSTVQKLEYWAKKCFELGGEYVE